MKRLTTILLMMALWTGLQAADDMRCLRLMDMALEGPIDSVSQRLADHQWTAWGTSDDGEYYYYRGQYYGIRAKLMVGIDVQTRLVTTAYVTVGPYSTQKMLERNLQYFIYKLRQENGELTARDGAWLMMDDYGSIKLTVVDNENGSKDIRALYVVDGAYYKDAVSMGLKGHIQEVVTENAVSQDQFLHFNEQGQLENGDLQERHYDAYGYLLSARMTEKEGYSEVTYDYDQHYRLKRRTLRNPVADVTYINDYVYDDEGELMSENQKVVQAGECVVTIFMSHQYLTRDEKGNWTSNSMSLRYWEKGGMVQNTTVLQKRTLAYWDE